MSTGGVVKRIRLGDDVLTYCGRCKEERTHQVVALNNGGGVERVICRTCHSNHLYRDRQVRTKKADAVSVRRREAKSAATSDARLYAYSPKEVYEKGQMIMHPKFGTGEVVEVRAGKIDVRFDGELRTLLHAG